MHAAEMLVALVELAGYGLWPRHSTNVQPPSRQQEQHRQQGLHGPQSGCCRDVNRAVQPCGAWESTSSAAS